MERQLSGLPVGWDVFILELYCVWYVRVDVAEEKAEERNSVFGFAAAPMRNGERDSDDDDYDVEESGEGTGEYSALTQQQQEELEKARNQVGPHRPSLLYCDPPNIVFDQPVRSISRQ
jgi:hypothetical protein